MEEKRTIETERLILREPRESDWQDIHKGGNHIEISKNLFNLAHPWPEQEAKDMVNLSIKQIKEIGDRQYFFQLKKTGEVMGNIRVGVLDGVGDLCGHVRFEYQGEGYMEEALKPVIEMLFKCNVVKEFTAYLFEDNEKARYLFEKFGFEQKLTEDYVVSKSNGKNHRLVKYYLTKPKWRKEIFKKDRTLL